MGGEGRWGAYQDDARHWTLTLKCNCAEVNCSLRSTWPCLDHFHTTSIAITIRCDITRSDLSLYKLCLDTDGHHFKC